LNRNMVPYALGALMLGVIGLFYGDFALQWQPVPEGISLRTPLAYASAIFLLVSGGVLLSTRYSPTAALSLGCFFGLWVVLLQTPKALSNPAEAGSWLGFAENLALALGGMAAWAAADTDPQRRKLMLRTIQLVFGLCLLEFGLCHFVYATFTADMIPNFFPFPLFWAYLTGAGHIAAGLALISGIATRLASTLLAAMFACFVLLLHVPRVIADPANRIEWTMLAISTALTGAAWLIRTATAQATGDRDNNLSPLPGAAST
jgi:uncharacterized membrane protein YphA (DoxX/SURF4 family)